MGLLQLRAQTTLGEVLQPRVKGIPQVLIPGVLAVQDAVLPGLRLQDHAEVDLLPHRHADQALDTGHLLPVVFRAKQAGQRGGG
jgi:hypothetical protein